MENTETARRPKAPTVPKKDGRTVMGEALPGLVNQMMEATQARPGQPTKRNPELIEEMCLRLARGMSLLMLCLCDDMPGYSTVMRWQREDSTLLDQFNAARKMTAYTIDEMNELIARGVAPYSTGDFRRDELMVSINNQRKRSLNRDRFDDKQTIDLNSTINIAVPVWANALAAPVDESVVDGQMLDPDEVFERQTVERLGIAIASRNAEEAQDDSQ